jgi:hypothetical protein
MAIEQRIGRIGQTRDVFVFNLVTAGAIEDVLTTPSMQHARGVGEFCRLGFGATWLNSPRLIGLGAGPGGLMICGLIKRLLNALPLSATRSPT